MCVWGDDAGKTLNASNGKWNVAVGFNALENCDARFQNVAVGQNCVK